MSDNIKEALQKLDVANENHWTQDGSPRLETVKFLNGGNAISREDIEKDFPGFNKSTAAGYWMTDQQPAQPPAQGTDSTTPEQGSSEPAAAPQQAPQAEQGAETPSAGGEGAAPEETKAPEQPAAGSDDGDAEGEAELPEMELGDTGPDAIENLEAAFSQVQDHIADLRGQVDSLNVEIGKMAEVETKIHNALQKARHERGDHKPATQIQQYLAAQKKRAAERGEARRAMLESGVNFKELQKLIGKSPLDQSMARPTGRRGRGSSGM